MKRQATSTPWSTHRQTTDRHTYLDGSQGQHVEWKKKKKPISKAHILIYSILYCMIPLIQYSGNDRIRDGDRLVAKG